MGCGSLGMWLSMVVGSTRSYSMESNGENVNHPAKNRRVATEQNDPKGTNADHPRHTGRAADDLFDDTVNVRKDNPKFDTHSPTQLDPSIEMVGESTSQRDPFSGQSGTHP